MIFKRESDFLDTTCSLARNRTQVRVLADIRSDVDTPGNTLATNDPWGRHRTHICNISKANLRSLRRLHINQDVANTIDIGTDFRSTPDDNVKDFLLLEQASYGDARHHG